MSRRSVFKSPADTALFSKHGYLRKPILDQQQVVNLKTLYSQYFPGGTEKFFSSTYLKDVALKQSISEELCSILLPAISSYFENYKVLGAQFLIKNPGVEGKMPYHQDWTVVDETKDRSLTVWIGLQDVDTDNGAIKVVAGSHEFSRALRGPGNFDALEALQPLLGNYAHTLTMQAGEAFIFDHSVIHGSGPNTTQQPRMAVAIGLVYKEAPLVFYHKVNAGNFEKYTVPDNFFITFPNNGKPPVGAECNGHIPHHFEKVSPEYFTDKMKELSTSPGTHTGIEPLFKNAALQQAFDTDGYVKINLLDAAEVEDLKNYYSSLQHDHIGEYGFHISLENKDEGYVSGVFKKLFSTVLPKLDTVLANYKAFTASYVIKEAGLQNIVPPHQDWTFVDEDAFTSATVWIALMDVNKNNGALGVIKGSHKLFNTPRTSPSPEAKSVLSDHAFNLFPFVEVIEMKAGEALIFNNRTVHASPPNTSGITRIAAGIGITHKNAQLRHYYQVPGAEENIEVYDVDEAFFLKYNNSILSARYNKGEALTELKKISTFRKTTPVLSKEEITALVSSVNGVTRNASLMAELAGLYNYHEDGTPKNKSTTKPVNMTDNTTPTTPANASADTVKTTTASIDTRTFFQKYTPANIIAEIVHRLKKK